jgi:hypothetical protein
MSRVLRRRHGRTRKSGPIDSFLVYQPTTIIITDDESDETQLQSSQQSTTSFPLSSSSWSFPNSVVTRKMTAAMRLKRDRAAAEADSMAHVSIGSSSSSQTDTGPPFDLDPFSLLSPPLSSSSPATLRCNPSVVRRSLSDIGNIDTRHEAARCRQARYDAGRRVFYQTIRRRFASGDDDTMCGYCGERKHVALHHEADFRRASAQQHHRPPSHMSSAELEIEVKRCTRKDGSIGLVSVCNQCHLEADGKGQSTVKSLSFRSRVDRNRRADDTAKLARGHCECDDHCGLLVTTDNLGDFEWDHRVQSFDDAEYHLVSQLVATACSLASCDKERKKCRLLYIECHRRHSIRQATQRREMMR